MEKRPNEIYTREDINALLSQCVVLYPTGLRDKAMIITLWRTGLRINEALELRVKDIDFHNMMIKVLRGKGHIARTVGLDIMLAEQLRQWIARRRELEVKKNAPLVISFGSSKGGPGKTTGVLLLATLSRLKSTELQPHRP